MVTLSERTLSVTDVAHRLGISSERARRLLLTRQLGTLRFGRLFVCAEELQQLEAAMAEGKGSPVAASGNR